MKLLSILITALCAVGTALADSSDTVAIGGDAIATGILANAVGGDASAIGRDVLAIAGDAIATGILANAVGGDAIATGFRTVAVGGDGSATGAGAMATGGAATAIGDDDDVVAIGGDATATGILARALGGEAIARGFRTVAMGGDASATGAGAMATGGAATAIGDDDDVVAIGGDAIATGILANAVGGDASAIGRDVLAIAGDAIATGILANAVGGDAIATGFRTVAVGGDASATGPGAMATGGAATAIGDDDDNVVAIGGDATATGILARALGGEAIARGFRTTAVGGGATATGPGAMATGGGATATGDDATAIGGGATATGILARAIAGEAIARGFRTLAVGGQATATGPGAIAVGGGADATGDDATAIGGGATATGILATAIGGAATAEGIRARALAGLANATGFSSGPAGFSSLVTGFPLEALLGVVNESPLTPPLTSFLPKFTRGRLLCSSESEACFVYNRKSGIGPDCWFGIDAPINRCCDPRGNFQSPIKLPVSRTIRKFSSKLRYRQKRATVTLKNNGFYPVFDIDGRRPELLGIRSSKNTNYFLASIHIHFGPRGARRQTEHVVKGAPLYDAEAHLVHFRRGFNTLSEASLSRDGVLVIAVFFSTRTGAVSPTYETMFKNIKKVQRFTVRENVCVAENFRLLILRILKISDTNEKVCRAEITPRFAERLECQVPNPNPDICGAQVKLAVNPNNLLPALPRFLQYKGGLTTPTCSESVVWYVAEKPTRTSRRSIKILQGMQSRIITERISRFGNLRPLQRLAKRKVRRIQFRR